MSLERVVAELRSEREALERSITGLQELLGRDSLQPTSAPHPDKSRDRYLERLEEYKFLRVELDAIWGQTYTTMNFMFVALGVMITAAFSAYGDALILLTSASLLTIGGYRLIRVHTTRVWRIVGYMRCALEKNLEGIRWETRLAERNKVLDSSANPDLDRDIFDGHVLLLDVFNCIIALVLAIVGLLEFFDAHSLAEFGKSPTLATIQPHWMRVFVIGVAASVPIGIFAWSRATQAKFKRGQKKENEHLDSWKKRNCKGILVAEVEPPDTVDEIS